MVSGEINWISIVLRSLGAIVFLFLLTKLLGKKQISQLSLLEFITGITLGELAGFISTDMETHYMHGIAALLTWVLVPFVLEYISLKSKTVRNFFEGKATVLIKEGKILEDNLKKERLTADELLESLRLKNVFKVADVEFALMEASGEVSVLLKKDKQPLSPSHLGIKVGPELEPQTVIIDGQIMDESLATIGLSREWLNTELEKIGVTRENVFLAQVDSYGLLNVDVYDDKLKMPQASQKEMLWATLKKCEADLELFALSSQTTYAKMLYHKCAVTLQHSIRQLEPYLKR